jgi:hypothetical protein
MSERQGRKRHSPEQIIGKLREADALLGGGASIGQPSRRPDPLHQRRGPGHTWTTVPPQRCTACPLRQGSGRSRPWWPAIYLTRWLSLRSPYGLPPRQPAQPAAVHLNSPRCAPSAWGAPHLTVLACASNDQKLETEWKGIRDENSSDSHDCSRHDAGSWRFRRC